MIVCPFNLSVLLDDLGDVFYCKGCPDCRLFTSLFPDPNSISYKEDVEK